MTRLAMLFSLLLSCIAGAADRPVVRWLLLDFPPYHIVSGPERGQGLRDQYLRRLFTSLPEFTHITELSSTERATSLMQAGATVCSVSLLRTAEREQFMLFSERPYFHQLPVRLLVGSHQADRIKPYLQQGNVNLSRLLAAGSPIRLGLLDKRRFGSPIDEIIQTARQRDPSPIDIFTSYGMLNGLLKLLDKGRVDATLGYTAEVEYLRQHDPSQGEITYFPLVESARLVPNHVSCSNTELGKQVMAAINRLPAQEASLAQQSQAYEALLPADERQRYRALQAAAH